MNKGFTSKELLIVVIVFGLTLGVIPPIISKNKDNANKQELVNKAKLYIETLNTDIINANINGKNTLYQTYLPNNTGETVTFKIENIPIDSEYKYNGIIKVTENSKNNYSYKIAIHNETFMLGTEKNLVNKEDIKLNKVIEYDSNLFNK